MPPCSFAEQRLAYPDPDCPANPSTGGLHPGLEERGEPVSEHAAIDPFAEAAVRDALRLTPRSPCQHHANRIHGKGEQV
jgi:hypothetical protein